MEPGWYRAQGRDPLPPAPGGDSSPHSVAQAAAPAPGRPEPRKHRAFRLAEGMR